MDAPDPGARELALAVLSAAVLEWEAAIARLPALSDDDWIGPAAELFRLGEAQLHAAAHTAHDALDRSMRITGQLRG